MDKPWRKRASLAVRVDDEDGGEGATTAERIRYALMRQHQTLLSARLNAEFRGIVRIVRRTASSNALPCKDQLAYDSDLSESGDFDDYGFIMQSPRRASCDRQFRSARGCGSGGAGDHGDPMDASFVLYEPVSRSPALSTASDETAGIFFGRDYAEDAWRVKDDGSCGEGAPSAALLHQISPRRSRKLPPKISLGRSFVPELSPPAAGPDAPPGAAADAGQALGSGGAVLLGDCLAAGGEALAPAPAPAPPAGSSHWSPPPPAKMPSDPWSAGAGETPRNHSPLPSPSAGRELSFSSLAKDMSVAAAAATMLVEPSEEHLNDLRRKAILRKSGRARAMLSPVRMSPRRQPDDFLGLYPPSPPPPRGSEEGPSRAQAAAKRLTMTKQWNAFARGDGSFLPSPRVAPTARLSKAVGDNRGSFDFHGNPIFKERQGTPRLMARTSSVSSSASTATQTTAQPSARHLQRGSMGSVVSTFSTISIDDSDEPIDRSPRHLEDVKLTPQLVQRANIARLNKRRKDRRKAVRRRHYDAERARTSTSIADAARRAMTLVRLRVAMGS